MKIRTPYGLLAAAVATGAMAAVPAIAQDQPEHRIISTAKATPSKTGTVKRPQGVSITANAQLITPTDMDPPIVERVEILVGKGLIWNDGKYTKCSKEILDRRGPGGCPRTSLMGSATATGMADTEAARVDLLIFNGGDARKFVYATLDNPARVRETLIVESEKLKGSGPWGHRETIRVPRSLQIIAGIPLRVTKFKMQIGGKSYAKDYVASTSCPQGGWKYQVTADYLHETPDSPANTVNTGSIPCTK
jgi:hypothetical protein